MRAIVQAIGVPALASRRAPDGGIVVIAANDDACRLFGLNAPSPEGRLADLLPRAVAEEVERAVGQCLGGQREVATEHIAGLADGAHWLRFRHRPFTGAGSEAGAGAGVISTVVAVGEGGADLAPGSAACAGACAHGQGLDVAARLVTGGGHALNNYLQPILTLARHMEGDMAPAMRARSLAFIRDAALQIGDVMDIVRAVLGAGAARGEVAGRIAMDALVRDALRAARLVLPPRIALSADVAAPDGQVAAHRAALLQLLLALILDAGDRLEGEGEVLLRVSRTGRDAPGARPDRPCAHWLELAVASRPEEGATPARLRQAAVSALAARLGGFAVFPDTETLPETRIFLPEIRDHDMPAA